MKIRYGNLNLESDLLMTEFIERGLDRDFFLDNDRRTLKIKDSGVLLDPMVTDVKKILIRASGNKNCKYCAIHLLSSDDLHSSFMSFIVETEKKILKLDLENGSTVMRMEDFK